MSIARLWQLSDITYDIDIDFTNQSVGEISEIYGPNSSIKFASDNGAKLKIDNHPSFSKNFLDKKDNYCLRTYSDVSSAFKADFSIILLCQIFGFSPPHDAFLASLSIGPYASISMSSEYKLVFDYNGTKFAEMDMNPNRDVSVFGMTKKSNEFLAVYDFKNVLTKNVPSTRGMGGVLQFGGDIFSNKYLNMRIFRIFISFETCWDAEDIEKLEGWIHHNLLSLKLPASHLYKNEVPKFYIPNVSPGTTYVRHTKLNKDSSLVEPDIKLTDIGEYISYKNNFSDTDLIVHSSFTGSQYVKMSDLAKIQLNSKNIKPSELDMSFISDSLYKEIFDKPEGLRPWKTSDLQYVALDFDFDNTALGPITSFMPQGKLPRVFTPVTNEKPMVITDINGVKGAKFSRSCLNHADTDLFTFGTQFSVLFAACIVGEFNRYHSLVSTENNMMSLDISPNRHLEFTSSIVNNYQISYNNIYAQNNTKTYIIGGAWLSVSNGEIGLSNCGTKFTKNYSTIELPSGMEEAVYIGNHADMLSSTGDLIIYRLILFLNYCISTEEIIRFEGLYSHKLGLQRLLPSNHEWKRSAPYTKSKEKWQPSLLPNLSMDLNFTKQPVGTFTSIQSTGILPSVTFSSGKNKEINIQRDSNSIAYAQFDGSQTISTSSLDNRYHLTDNFTLLFIGKFFYMQKYLFFHYGFQNSLPNQIDDRAFVKFGYRGTNTSSTYNFLSCELPNSEEILYQPNTLIIGGIKKWGSRVTVFTIGNSKYNAVFDFDAALASHYNVFYNIAGGTPNGEPAATPSWTNSKVNLYRVMIFTGKALEDLDIAKFEGWASRMYNVQLPSNHIYYRNFPVID